MNYIYYSMPSPQFTVAFSDVVVPQRLYRGGKFIGFSSDSFEACPTKTFVDEHAYERWSNAVDAKFAYLSRFQGRHYRNELAELGLSIHHSKDDLKNVLRFGERWCERNIPPKMCQHKRLGLVVAPRPEYDDDDEDDRVTGPYEYEHV